MDQRSVNIMMSSIVALCSLTVVACKIIWPWRGKAKGVLAQWCHRLRRRPPSDEGAEVELRVREECLKRHMERAGTFIVLFSIPCTYYAISTLWGSAAGRPVMPLLSMVIGHANLLFKSVLPFFVKFMTPRVVDAVYIESIANLAVVVIVGPSSLASMRILRLMQFFFWSLYDLKPWLNAIGAVCLLLSEVAAVVQLGVPIVSLIPSSAALLSASLALTLINHCLEQSIRFEILAKDSKSELTAVQTLLDSICDVVVQLDSKLRLKQHSVKLADVLFQPVARSLAGADLRDFMPSDTDREAFSTNVCMKDEETAQSNVFHARLRDSTRSSVAMEFFTVGFKGSDGSQHHLVGMREHTDIQPLTRPALPLPPPPPPLPIRVEMPRNRHAEGDVQLQRGTPSSLKHWDLRSHGSGSRSRSAPPNSEDGRSDSDSESSHSVSPPAGSPGAGGQEERIETSELARIVTTNYLLLGWNIGAARHSCCPKHAAVASLQRVASSLAEQGCTPEYKPITVWQCRRCGIMAREHRDPKHKSGKKCLLCKGFDDVQCEPNAGAGARIIATL